MLLLALAALQAASVLAAEKGCDDYLGTIVQPLTFAAAEAKLKTPPKLDYAYQAWDRSADLIIGKPVDPKQVHYDAGPRLLRVSLYALDNMSVGYADVFGSGTPYDGKVEFGPFGNIDVVISEGETPVGHYTGSNAFGAQRRVTQNVRVTKAIFDRAAEPDQTDLFWTTGKDKVLANIPIGTGQDLRKLKLSAAFVVNPKWPYIASGTKDWGAATIDDPQEVKQKISVIVATIRCGLLLDGNKVIAAFRAKARR